mmetsp:Transcript_10768/g.12118  ORF Transcript_10768/g.12118 Transcript_10768/m.12118 type:complete len:86 (-) Transcript_10768:110-367(-)
MCRAVLSPILSMKTPVKNGRMMFGYEYIAYNMLYLNELSPVMLFSMYVDKAFGESMQKYPPNMNMQQRTKTINLNLCRYGESTFL